MLFRSIGLFSFCCIQRTQGGTAIKKDNENTVQVPIWHKANLSIEKTVIYSGIGRDKLYEITNREDCPFVLWGGNRRMIKRKQFDE